MPPVTPMRLLRIPEPFDHPDFVYEAKLDGFRALAHVRRPSLRARLAQWAYLRRLGHLRGPGRRPLRVRRRDAGRVGQLEGARHADRAPHAKAN